MLLDELDIVNNKFLFAESVESYTGVFDRHIAYFHDFHAVNKECELLTV